MITYLLLSLLISFLFYLLTDTQTVHSNEFLGIKRIASKFQQFLWMFFPLSLGYEFTQRSNKEQKITMGIFLIAIISFIISQTLSAIEINPDAAREFHTADTAYEEVNPFVGNYYFVYLIPFLVISLISIFLQIHNIIVRILTVVLIIVLFDFLLKAQFTLALLITIIGIVIILGVYIRPSIAKVLYVLLILVASCLIPIVLSYAINHIESDLMVERLKEIYSFFVSGDSSGYNLNGRMNLYKSSFFAFLESPIWGNRYLPFDGHATLLTIPADLGLLGAIPFYYLLFNSRILAIRYVTDKALINVVFIMLLLMGFTNPIHSSSQISFGVWFITPFVIDLLYTITHINVSK